MKLTDCVALPHREGEGVKLVETQVEPLPLAVTEAEKEDVNVGECVPLELLLAEALRDIVVQTLCVTLPHCEREGVKLAETHELLLMEAQRDAVAQVLCVTLPHCEGEGVKLAECEVLPHCEREGVKLVETQEEPLTLAVTEVEKEGVNVEECVPLGLLLAEALRDAVTQPLSVALPHCEKEGVKLAECVALPHCEREGVKLEETQEEPLTLADTVALPHCEREGV